MATASVGDIYAFTLRGQMASQTILNTFHYRLDVIDGTPTVETVYDGMHAHLDLVGSALTDRFIDCMPDDYALIESIIQRVATTRQASKRFTITDTGNYGHDGVTANVAGVITRRGELANRKNVGGVHLVYPTAETGLTDGLASTGWKTLADALATQIRTAFVLPTTTTLMTPVLYNRGSTPNYSPIVSTTVQPELRVMRRRTVGLGI